MRRALELSVNVIAIKLNDLVDPKNVVRVARLLGISSPLKPILSITLGANEVTMLELASSYTILANSGRKINPTSILHIQDRDGSTLYEYRPKESRVFPEKYVSTLVDMMRGTVTRGTGKNARLPGRAIAGKTGTTSDYKDAWFFGFVPQLVCSVWVGNDDNTPMNIMTGGWFPALMWRDFMKHALKSVKPMDFQRPKGLVTRKVNWLTGQLATDGISPEKYIHNEKYWRGKEPTNYDTQDSMKRLTIDAEKESHEQEKELLDFFNL